MTLPDILSQNRDLLVVTKCDILAVTKCDLLTVTKCDLLVVTKCDRLTAGPVKVPHNPLVVIFALARSHIYNIIDGDLESN